jgi:molybdate transport system ATP-binding protein
VLTSHRPKELPANVTHVARIEGGRIVEKKRGHSSFPRRPAAPLATTEMRNVPISQPLVTITNATIYRDYRLVIRDLDWTLRSGEHWAVLGANGTGKSTLLSLIYGDLHPALGGTIERAGLSVGERIDEWKRRVAWVSPELQADHFAARSLEEVVVSGRYASVGLNAPPTAADRRIARRWLEFFGIAALRDRGPRSVSYGQMRLALLARAMANDPELLLLDEPCAGLDGDIREHVLREIERLARSGTQIVMAVHDAEDIVPSVENVLQLKGKGRWSVRPGLPPRRR